MGRNFRRPKTDEALREIEAAGLWKAQALAKQIGESREKITLEVIRRIHRVFFVRVNPDIAGRFRRMGEDIKKLRWVEPPPGSAVAEQMYSFWRNLDTRIAQLPSRPHQKNGKLLRKALVVWNQEIISLAAWVQYEIARIHPFCEGNGRMARLMTNLILYRFHLPPTDIKYEGENKEAYLKALGAIDRNADFRLLAQLITKGMIASSQKIIEARKRAEKG